jgi:hypothetical protein
MFGDSEDGVCHADIIMDLDEEMLNLADVLILGGDRQKALDHFEECYYKKVEERIRDYVDDCLFEYELEKALSHKEEYR